MIDGGRAEAALKKQPHEPARVELVDFRRRPRLCGGRRPARLRGRRRGRRPRSGRRRGGRAARPAATRRPAAGLPGQRARRCVLDAVRDGVADDLHQRFLHGAQHVRVEADVAALPLERHALAESLRGVAGGALERGEERARAERGAAARPRRGPDAARGSCGRRLGPRLRSRPPTIARSSSASA